MEKQRCFGVVGEERGERVRKDNPKLYDRDVYISFGESDIQMELRRLFEFRN